MLCYIISLAAAADEIAEDIRGLEEHYQKYLEQAGGSYLATSSDYIAIDDDLQACDDATPG